MAGDQLNNNLGGYSDKEWARIDLEMAAEQAFGGEGPIGMVQSVDLAKHANRFQELTEGTELDLSDPVIVTALTTVANIVADSDNNKAS